MSDISLVRRAYRRYKFWRSRNLHGAFDGLRGSTLSGWAHNVAMQSHRPLVEILESGRVIASGRADSYRSDLAEQGFGDGAYGFEIVLPRELIDGNAHSLEVRVDGHYSLTPEPVVFHESPPTIGSRTLSHGQEEIASSAAIAKRSANDPSEQLRAERRWAYEQKFISDARIGKHPAPEKLSFPFVEKPRASIVIPLHNQFDLTWNCLQAIQRNTEAGTFEIVLVDDGSSDETATIAEYVEGVTLIRHDEAVGFVGSCNEGAGKARGEYVILLNSDTEVAVRWLEELLWPFEQQDGVGLVGAQLIYPDGRLQESGGIIWKDGSAWNYGRNDNALHPRFNYTRNVDYVSGACIALPMELWNKLNGFDPIFAPGYYEDSDLAFRVRAAGYLTLVAPLAKVFHLEGGSSGTDLSSGMKQYQVVNEPKFRERWHDDFRANGVPGVCPDLEKDRGVTRRALVLDAQTPTPDKDAGSYAAIQEMRLLRSLGFKLTFAAQNLLYTDGYTDALQRDGIEVLFEPYYRSFREILEERGAEFDLIYVTRYYVANSMIDDARRFAPQAKIVMNNADLHFLREMREAVVKGSEAKMRTAVATREAELSAMRKVDLVLSYNEVEHAVIMSHNLNSTPVMKTPWVVELPEHVPPFEKRKDIAFLGSYGHPPNVEAVKYFVSEVMPLIREQIPGANFLIYGSGVTEEIRQLEASDVIVKGFVESVDEVYNHCRVFVVPLLTGAGLKGKVVGALAHGLPSVLSPVALEGTEIRVGLDALSAQTPDEWASKVQTLYSDACVWREVSSSARELASSHYSFSVAEQSFMKSMSAIGISISKE